MVQSNFNYTASDLTYLKSHAASINSVAATLGVSPEAVAGGVLREMTLTSQYYPHLPIGAWAVRTAGQAIQNVNTTGHVPPPESGQGIIPLTHDEIAGNYKYVTGPTFSQQKLNNPGPWDRWNNVTLNDVGPGKVQLKTAIDYLQKYNSEFPDSDPLDLKKYNQQYAVLLRDLKDPDNDVTFKISGLIARDGDEFFRANLPQGTWDALPHDQQTALLTQYYARGKANVANTISANKGAGSTADQTVGDLLGREPSQGALFGTNPAALRDALSITKGDAGAPSESLAENTDASPGDGRAASPSASAPPLRAALEQRAANLGVAYGAYMPTDALLAEIHGREGEATLPQDADATADRIEHEMDMIGAPFVTQPELADPPALGSTPLTRADIDQRAAAFGLRFGAAVPDDRVLAAVHTREAEAAPPAAADALADRIERELDGTVAAAGIPWAGGDGDVDADEAQA
jgi:hypothetical protein